MRITPTKWGEFQHYKDRAPPWIKLHKGLLNNPKWHRLQLASRALAPLLWLLASDAEGGIIDEADDDVAFRLRCTADELRTAVSDLIANDFFISCERPASKTPAKRQPPATPEGETEKEVEGEKEAKGEVETPAPADADAPNPLNAETWKAYKAAYLQRYGVDPVRNTPVNSKIKAVVQRLGVDAPAVAEHYVRSEKPYYVGDRHGVGPLLKDCEGLRTEWAAGLKPVETKKGNIHDQRAETIAGFLRPSSQERDITADSAVVG